MLYIALLVIILAPSIFAAWPPEGVVTRQSICYPRLNAHPWDEPGSYSQNGPAYYFGNNPWSAQNNNFLIRFVGELINVDATYLMIYWNNISLEYERTIDQVKILRN